MSGESIFDILGDSSAGGMGAASTSAVQRKTRGPIKKGDRAPPPTASTFGIHGTSAVVGNAGGEFTEPSVHPYRKPVGTFGREVGSTVDPAVFLKKNEGPNTASRGAPTVNLSKFKKADRDDPSFRKPDIPSRYDRPVMGLKTDKNYVLANAVENTLAIPTKPNPAVAENPVHRADYGKVPDYLSEIKDEIKARRETMENVNSRMRAANERWSELTPSELAELRTGLQSRWDTLNKEYQSRGFSKLETPSQKAHQVTVEKELRAVEFAMQKLSRNHVFVYDDLK